MVVNLWVDTCFNHNYEVRRQNGLWWCVHVCWTVDYSPLSREQLLPPYLRSIHRTEISRHKSSKSLCGRVGMWPWWSYIQAMVTWYKHNFVLVRVWVAWIRSVLRCASPNHFTTEYWFQWKNSVNHSASDAQLFSGEWCSAMHQVVNQRKTFRWHFKYSIVHTVWCTIIQ